MSRLANFIAHTPVQTEEIALFSLAQAGFCLTTAAGTRVIIDPYLSDCCATMFGFKRMIPAPLTPEEVQADLFLATHAHADHLDPEALPVYTRRTSTIFVAAADCREALSTAGVPNERMHILATGDGCTVRDINVHATYADHGDLAPQAIGLLLTVNGITIYHTGDTGYAPAPILASLHSSVDIMIAPINGQFGNLDARQACLLAAQVRPRLLIAAHFWMFIEHGGDPAIFRSEAEVLLPTTPALVLAPGERVLFSRDAGLLATRTLEADGLTEEIM